jgi:hypothetical protein
MQDLEQYLNDSGTYTSPKNGKVYKTLKSLRAHLSYAGHINPASFKDRLYNIKCQFCCDEIIVSNIKRHEAACYLNPSNMANCKVCSKPIKDYKKSKGTCSRSCANVYFKSGENNGNWNPDAYRSTCFNYHQPICVICGEDKIVAVHHYDENHNNNDPANLIPLCPTHHQYVHSRYKNLVQSMIEDYILQWKLRNGV